MTRSTSSGQADETNPNDESRKGAEIVAHAIVIRASSFLRQLALSLSNGSFELRHLDPCHGN
jgi:hypothetical protein